MASSLDEFLALEPEDTKIETHSVMMKNGKELEVDVRSLTLEQFKRAKKTSTDTYDNPNGGAAVAQIEEIAFSQKLCAMGIVEPSLNNAKLRAKFKVHSNEDLVAALFPIQSIIQLGGQIAKLTLGDYGSGEEIPVSNGTDPKLIEEAKN